jgi:hypothetical protein
MHMRELFEPRLLVVRSNRTPLAGITDPALEELDRLDAIRGSTLESAGR